MKSCKIALAQINPILGNLAYNKNKILTVINKLSGKADLVVFPELSLIGYPPEDLILREKIHLETLKYLKIIKQYARDKGIAVILGAPQALGKKIGNAAIFFNGSKTTTIFKNNLPNYGVFDEKRIFKEGPPYDYIKYKKLKIGLMICEDMWTDKIAKRLIKKTVDLFICINASPYDHEKQAQRYEVAKKITNISKKPIIYVNQIGGQDELVFDGGSFVLDGSGKIISNLKIWTEDVKVVDILGNKSRKNNNVYDSESILFDKNFNMWNALVLGLRDYVYKNSFKKIILGLSGGIDSAVSAAIAVDAIGSKNVIGIKLPSKFSSKGSLVDAEESIKLLGIESDTIKINNIHKIYLKILKESFDNKLLKLTEENLQSRIRGVLLMAYSNNYSYLLISTGNKSEMSVGYSTIYGDMNGGFNVLKDVYKTELYKLANWRNNLKEKLFKGPYSKVIPENSITKPPSAELSLNQKDTDSLPPYEILDEILYYLIEKEFSLEEICKKGFKSSVVKKIRNLLVKSEYKRRQAPPGVKISVRSFGKERRYPITNQFKI